MDVKQAKAKDAIMEQQDVLIAVREESEKEAQALAAEIEAEGKAKEQRQIEEDRLDYQNVSDADVLERAGRTDIITIQGRVRRKPDLFREAIASAETVVFDMSDREAPNRLTDREVARRALGRLIGDPNVSENDPRVDAMLQLAQ